MAVKPLYALCLRDLGQQQYIIMSIFTKMAEKPKERQSKIPRFVRTTTPVLSTGYRKVLKEIKIKRAEIEVKERKIDDLKNSLLDLKIGKEPKEPAGTALSTTRSGRSAQAEARHGKTNVPSSEFVGSKLRSTILTPGGTKLKGTLFKSELFYIEYITKYRQ